MAHPIGIGVIGMGWMGLAHSRAYRNVADRFYESGIRPRLVICADDVEARARQAQATQGFAEITTDWHRVSVTFETPGDCDLLRIVLRRYPSDRIYGNMKGTVWIDDVNLKRIR